ncbi:MAG: N(G),N(G)-dimethylarginine dimethylaminohydrolase [bacterium]|nr:N(G),N(G)-dimethylarginine dimethylaminohydrolase [bacterium]
MFTRAIVRTPGRSMITGLSSADLGIPDYHLALKQHAAYIRALERCGLTVEVLPADEEHPDSTFVEDTALLTPRCAVITNPGAPTRRGESANIRAAVTRHYPELEEIESPGTVEAGDIMMTGNHFHVGLSARTNAEGARQLIALLERYGHTGSVIELKEVLHLKTGVSYLEDNNLVACGEFLAHPALRRFNIIAIPDEESYAANCIRVNDRVLMPAGYPLAEGKILSADYAVTTIDVSEFRKLDGGLSCLSLRF